MTEDFLDIIMKKTPANRKAWDIISTQAQYHGLNASDLLLQLSNVEYGHKELQQLIPLWGQWAGSQRPYLSHHKLEQLKKGDGFSDSIVAMANDLRARAHTIRRTFEDMLPALPPGIGGTAGQADLFTRHAEDKALVDARLLAPLKELEASLQTIYDDSEYWRSGAFEEEPAKQGAFERYTLEQTLSKRLADLGKHTRQTEQSFVRSLESNAPITSRGR